MHILLLPLALLWSVAVYGQRDFETCINFDDVALTPGADVLPDGWTFLPGSGDTASSAGVRNWRGYGNSKGVVFVSYGKSYLSLPDLGLPSYDGYQLQLHFKNHLVNNILYVGCMSDPTDSSTFVQLGQIVMSTEWHGATLDLSAWPDNCRYLTFLNDRTDHDHATVFIDDIHITRHPCLTWGFHLASVTQDSAFFEWEETGMPDKEIRIYLYDPDSVIVIQGVEGQRFAMPVDTLRPTCVQLVVHSCVGYDGSCSDYFESEPVGIPLPDRSECVNISLLYSNKCTPYYGNFDNPYANEGYLNYQSDPARSRHTLMTDTTEHDPVVGAALRTIPQGETMAVRLGNWRTGSEAEAMRYTIEVDTARADMLVLKYASVMQNSGHRPEKQPRFRIEMLNQEMNPIEPAPCNSHDFIASSELGWNVYGEYNADSVWEEVALWKDWTTVGIDLTAYHGQTVHLRLTTYDCSNGGHFGYAYYTLACAKKRIEFLSCTSGDSNRVAAPEGFTYRWWRDDMPFITVGNSREATLPMDNHTYHCTMGFLENPECTVTMDVVSRLIMPEAHIGYDVAYDSCRRKITFHNRSHLVGDTLNRGAYTEWLFDDGTTSMLDDPVRMWNDTLAHIVTLVSGLSMDGDCFDTIRDTLKFIHTYDTSAAIVCGGAPYMFHGHAFTQAGTYTLAPLCDTVHTLLLALLPAPEAEFRWEPETPVDVAPEVQFINYTRPEGCDYRWFVQGVDGTDTLEGYEPSYRWGGSLPRGDYEVALVASQTVFHDTTKYICHDTVRHTVSIVTALLQFPNLVTPNGDGTNDLWEVVNLLELGVYPMNEIWIYDAWGKLVYHVENVRRREQFWDPLATRSPDGTYYFRFSGKGSAGIIRLNGVIEVIR